LKPYSEEEEEEEEEREGEEQGSSDSQFYTGRKSIEMVRRRLK
jgi:hypothetical protein